MTVHKQLEEYYRDLFVAHDGVPKRSDVNPLYLKKILSWVFLAERRGPKNLVPTVVGSGIDDAFNGGFTGANMFDYYPADVAEPLEVFFKNIVSKPCGGFLVRSVSKKDGMVGTYETLMYPLRDEKGIRNKLIGSVLMKQSQLVEPQGDDNRGINSMLITEIIYRDIGFGIPE